MRPNYLAYSFSYIIMYLGMILLVPVAFALMCQDFEDVYPFLIPSVCAFMLSFMIKKMLTGMADIKNLNYINKSEGLLIVTLTWVMGVIAAAIPFLFYGFSPIDAFFEGASGITSTGATILTSYDYSKTFFFWRAFTQWLGGMGIIVLVIAILPQFAIAGRQMFFAEAPGPIEDKFTPRIKSTAASLWKVYGGLTVLEIVLLKLGGMSLFDAICHSLACVSGGGFSTSAHSLSAFSVPVMWITIAFMFFAGMSFNLQYLAWSKLNPLVVFKNEEFRVYFKGILIVATLLVCSLMVNMNYGLGEGVLHSVFNVTSAVSTTGFCSVDYNHWDFTSKALLFLVMFLGSCASSTGGGIKIVRWILMFKVMKSELVKILHPKAVVDIKYKNNSVPKDVLYQILIFVGFYFGILAVSALFVSLVEKNVAIGVTGAVSALGNIGPGFSIIGPMSSFETLQPMSKGFLIFDMIAGRLELIPILVMLRPDFWTFKKV